MMALMCRKQSSSVECDAVLDMKWLLSDPTHLLVAHSTGSASIYQLDFEMHQLNLLTKQVVTSDTSTLLLSTASLIEPYEGKMLASLSDGSLVLHDLVAAQSVAQWPVHDYEAWTAIQDTRDANSVLSGGDDSALAMSDLRTGSRTWRNAKTHSSGVVSILVPAADEQSFISGEYNDRIHVLDRRRPLQQASITSCDVGGGVWRLQEYEPHRILVCAMHAGAKLGRYSPRTQNFELLDSFERHESMCYGASAAGGDVFASCSFYDKRVCLWAKGN